ncbi:unnamed protein product [Prorocentrum cordatum]|nr:unnamed protein product [Polarella glacialis]
MLPRYSTFTLASVERWPMTWKRGGCPVYVYERLRWHPLDRPLLPEPWASAHAAAAESGEEAAPAGVGAACPPTACLVGRAAAVALLFSLLPLCGGSAADGAQLWPPCGVQEKEAGRCR